MAFKRTRKGNVKTVVVKRKKKTSATAIAKKALRIARGVSPEVKYYELTDTGQQFNNDLNSTSYLRRAYSGIAVGTGDLGTRIGDRIKVIRMTLDITLYNSSDLPCVYRIIGAVLKDNPDNTITPTASGNLLLDSNFMGTTNMPNAPKDYDNRKAWIICVDKTTVINPVFSTGAGSIYNQAKQLSFNIKPPMNVQFGAGGASTIVKNDFTWFFGSNLGASSSRYASYVLRVYYTDA